ncbi:MAG TPA: ATP-binding protein [Pseudomonadales bacterium]|nr:ATP-binding protein [Pseudomonadales bacterium]
MRFDINVLSSPCSTWICPKASGRHLLSLINDILDLSKIEAGRLEIFPEPVAIVDLCNTSLAFIKEPAIKKGVSVSFVPDPKVSHVVADARRLKQILVNLLTNAVKFTPTGGKVTLTVAAILDENAIEFSVSDIIALTALAMTGDRERCLAAGANEYLSKPLRLTQLAEIMHGLLKK